MRRAAIRAAAGCAAPALAPVLHTPLIRLPHAAARRTAADTPPGGRPPQAAATAAEALELIEVLRSRNVDIAGLTTIDKLRAKVQATADAVGEPRKGEGIGADDLDPGDRVWVSAELTTDSYDEVLLPAGTTGIVLDVERKRKTKGKERQVHAKIDFEGIRILQWLFEDKIPLLLRDEPKEVGEKRDFSSPNINSSSGPDRNVDSEEGCDNEDDGFWDNDNYPRDPRDLPGEEEQDADATRTLTLSIGQRLHTKRLVLSDNLEREAIQAGTPGVVLGVDSRHDVQIDFDGVKKLQWMTAGRFDRDLRLLPKKWDQGKKGERKRERRVFESKEEKEAFFASLPQSAPKLMSGRAVSGKIEVPRSPTPKPLDE